MQKLISERLAIGGLLIVFSVLLVFHFMIITGVIPFDIVWGGRLQSRTQMIQFETISIILNAVMLTIVAIKARLLKWNLSTKILRFAFWVMCGLFLLNSFGNFFSNNQFEKIVFTPLTIIISIFCFRLAIGNTEESKT